MISAASARLLPYLLAALAMLGPFSINIYMPSFAEMKSVFGVGDVEMQLTLSLYFAAFAFMSLWHGAIADSFGRRPVVIVGLLVYALAALGCAIATNIEQIYVCRLLQGASAGAGIVVGRAVIRDLYKGVEAQRLYALVIMLFALAPAIGPVVGGYLQVHLGWRATFGFLTLLTLVMLGLVLRYLPESLPREQRHPFSGVALLTAYREVITNKPFVMWAASFAFMFAGYFIYMLSGPVFLIRHLHLTETDFIWLFGPATVGMMFGSHLSGRLAASWSARRSITVGFVIMLIATVWNLLIGYWHPLAYGWYLPYLLLYTLGMALAQPAIVLLGLDCVPDRRGMGASLQLFIQTGFNSLVSAVIAPFFWGTPFMLAIGAALLLGLALTGVVFTSWLSTRQLSAPG